MKKLTYILFVIFFCCNKNNFIANKERVKIYQNLYLSTPDTTFQSKKNEIVYLKKEEGDFEYILTLSVLEKIGEKWNEKTKNNISSGYHYYFSDFEYVTLVNEQYIYYEEFQPGGNMGNFDLEFVLYNLDSNEKHFIHYTELPEKSYTKTEFKRSNNLLKNKVLLSFLEKKLNSSNKIHKPDIEEKMVKEFIVKNEKQLFEIKKAYSINRTIQFNNYRSELNYFENLDSIKKKSIKLIENNDFIIFSKFKGPVLGYNKKLEKYFCVWVPNSMYDWVNKMNFDSMGNLILFERFKDEPEYLINLYNKKYKRLK